jgi:putative hydrolase of the HAD superfamily
MIVAFDLDDTLYEEINYVRSGFHAVANTANEKWGIPSAEAFEILWASLASHGRGRQFNELLRHLGVLTQSNLRLLINCYRHHQPSLALPELSRKTLIGLGGRPLFLVTDGHKVVQAMKIEALGLGPFFKHCYLTNRYGVRYQKPATRVFELLLSRQRCRPEEVVYVGDNPHKDFCGVRPMGIRTIRLRSGPWKGHEVAPGRDAEIEVDRLDGVLEIVTRWEKDQARVAARSSL